MSHSGKILVTRHVVVDEKVFPFRDFLGGFLFSYDGASVLGSRPSSIPAIPILSSKPLQHDSSAQPQLEQSQLVSAPTISSHVVFGSATYDVLLPNPACAPHTSSSIVPPPSINAHPMTTRSKNGIRKPKVLDVIVQVSLEPNSIKEALSIPH